MEGSGGCLPDADGERTAAPPRDHIAALDGIRGAAAAMVLLYHFGLNAKDMGLDSPLISAAGAGWIGVDLFFVLSGFLITGILYDAKGGTGYFASFYVRRALRIFPLYFGAIMVVHAITILFPAFLSWNGTRPWWLPTFVTNFVYAQRGGAVTGVMTHYWTLAIEEQFYLLWPLTVWLCGRRQLMVIAGAMILAAPAFRLVLMSQQVHAEAIFSLTPTRLDGLAWGAAASLAIRGGEAAPPARSFIRLAILCSGAALAGIALVRQTASPFDPVIQTMGYSLLGCLFSAIIIASLSAGLCRTILVLPWLRWLGKYSYGLYVWHPIIGSMIFYGPHRPPAVGGSGAVLIFAGIGALNLLTAWISYHYWEKPFLLLKRYVSRAAPRPSSEPDVAGSQRSGEVCQVDQRM